MQERSDKMDRPHTGFRRVWPLLALLVSALLFAQPASSQDPEVVVLEGLLQLQISEDFKGNESSYEYLLETYENRLVGLKVGEDVDEPRAFIGESVVVSGVLSGDTLTVSALTPAKSRQEWTADAPIARASQVLGDRKMLLILLNFTNDPSEPWTPEQARGVYFTDPDSVNAYYQEVSAGLISFSGIIRPDGDVFGWYTVPLESDRCRVYEWRDAAIAAATAAGFDVDAYDHVVFMFPPTPCSWGAFSWFLHPHSYLNGDLRPDYGAHEIGHNLGLYHSAGYACVEDGVHVAISGGRLSPSVSTPPCRGWAYGDFFTIMGTGYDMRHPHNRDKEYLGILPSANILELSAGDHIVTLAPSEQPLIGQVQEVQIPRGVDGTYAEYYSLEFRQPYGQFDDFLPGDPAVNGVSIRIFRNTNLYSNRDSTSWLIDTVPATANEFQDAPLLVGNTLNDVWAGISITTLDVSPTGVTIRIVVDDDSDNDGCSDVRENGSDETLGGFRDPTNPWDFYDVDGFSGPDGYIDLIFDVLGVIDHWQPLAGGAPPYDVAFDRGPSAGPNPWNMTAPDGVIDLINDILGVIDQWNHDCR